MSTYVLMRILESAPGRYDTGLRLLTLGRADRVRDRLAERLGPGQRVLDVGCGTGAMAVRAARRGARVKGVDVSPGMLEVAARRAREAGLADRVELAEMGIAELDSEPAERYDAVTSVLCFSELGDAEIAFGLKEIRRILKPGGLLLLADEARPHGARRLVQALVRAPMALLAYVITGQTTRPVADLPGRVAGAGFTLERVRASALGSFVEIVARRPGPELS